MVMTVDPVTKYKLGPIRTVTDIVSVRTQVTGRQALSQKVHPARSDWVQHVARICDHQDQTAFAELFHHFAPRVKAFLMKSGADAGMAEECAQEVMATLWHKAHMFDPARASVAT